MVVDTMPSMRSCLLRGLLLAHDICRAARGMCLRHLSKIETAYLLSDEYQCIAECAMREGVPEGQNAVSFGSVVRFDDGDYIAQLGQFGIRLGGQGDHFAAALFGD